jgi:hypothetical protein
MFSGLLQVTIIAIWAIFLPPANLIHLTWIFLLYSTTQYPAMQSVFKNALSALQQFDKASILSFLEGDVIQKLSEIGFVLFFRYTLGQNPQYQIILACAMGLVLGKYMDDFLVMVLGMYYFNRTLQKYGISARVCFYHDLDWKLVKESFIFGVKTGLPGAIGSFAGLLVLVWWLSVNQYSTFVALFGLAASIVNFVQSLTLDLGGAISESYLNGKKKLCQYYIGQSFRFDALVQIMLYSIIFIVSLVLEPTLIGIGLSYYLLAIPFILPIMIRRFITPYERLAGTVITSANHPNVYFMFEMIALGINMIMWFLLLVVFRIPQQYGLAAIFWVMPLGDSAGIIFKVTASFLYVNRKIVPVKIPLWQTFGGTSVAGATLCLIGWLYYNYIFNALLSMIGLFLSLAIAIILIVLGGVFLIYIPITTLLGVWDNGSVESFQKAAKIAGFAKILVVPMLKILEKTIPFAKLHNRFAMNDSEALQEARDLMKIKELRLQIGKPSQ